MRNACRYSFIILALLTLLTSCSGAGTTEPKPAEMDSAEAKGAVVIETMNSGGYTYVLLQQEAGEMWVAGPETAVEPGDRVIVSGGMEMKNFTSQSLDRTFETILFAGSLHKEGESSGDERTAMMAEAHNAAGTMSAMSGEEAPTVESGSVKKADGGHTVGELYAKKDELAGQTVTIRGTVVKYNAQIMGKNWLHIQDGSGETGTNDLTVTTSNTAMVGDTVLVKGIVILDKDFGAGYKYDLLIEDAQITKE
jgi:hypothetical protein